MLDFGYYNMDCMQGMKEFPDKYFDLAIVDPPYGINVGSAAMGIGGGVAPHRNRSAAQSRSAKERPSPKEVSPDIVTGGVAKQDSIQVGGVSACRPKSITRSMIQKSQMPSISRNSSACRSTVSSGGATTSYPISVLLSA